MASDKKVNNGNETNKNRTPKAAPPPEIEKVAWERQDGEGVKPFQAFAIYRDMGMDRSLRDVAKQLGKSLTIIARWSGHWKWVERCKKYDEELDRVAQKALKKSIADMNKRHADAAVLFQQKLLQRLATVKPDDLTPGDMIKWLTEAAKLERLARGEPTEHTKQTGEPEGGKKESVFDIAETIMQDPEAADLACKLFERFAMGQGDASRASEVCEP
jgi:hypothetical protein